MINTFQFDNINTYIYNINISLRRNISMNKDKINNIITNKDLGVMDLRIFIYMLINK